ncbi:MAG: DUF2334 domain-containing protein [archaeon]|jgi:hypothetical protein
MKQYNLFRLDDVCDKMPNYQNVFKFIKLLNKYNIKPLMGVIPAVKDELIIDQKSTFKIKELEPFIKKNQIIIALHGYEHKYSYGNKGILKLNSKSEFSGLNFNSQSQKIKSALSILKKELAITPKYFFAPSHNYDENTLAVLKEYNLINVDGISLYPFEYLGVKHIPQQKNQLNPKLDLFKNGIFVNHFHPDEITTTKLIEIEKFCKEHKSTLINFDDLDNINISRNSFENSCFVKYKGATGTLEKIKYPIDKIKKFGFYNLVAGLIKKEKLKKECQKYKFNKWHINPIELRPYALDCVKEVNKIISKEKLTSVYEIGCGLGEILNKIKAKIRVGYDIEPEVLIAGAQKFKKIIFNYGSFNDIKNKNIDVLITVNFIHEIKPSILKKYYANLIKYNRIKYIAVDSVNYKYNHNFKQILPREYKLVFKSKVFENNRTIQIYGKK